MRKILVLSVSAMDVNFPRAVVLGTSVNICLIL